MNMKYLVGKWLLFFSLFYSAKAQCVDDTSFEYPSAYSYTDGGIIAEATATGYLLEPSDYHVPDSCTCGLLKQWQFHAGGAGAIQLQVWKRQASNSYLLMGENYYTVPASATGRLIEFLVPAKDRITVRNGDLLGWYTGAGVNIVSFSQGPQNQVSSPQDHYPDGIKIQTAMSDSTVGETFDWNSGSVTILEDTIYAFGATVTSNTAPEFTNLDHKVIIYSSWVAGAVLYTVSADDKDSYDVDSLEVTMDDDISGYYMFDLSSYEVTLITSFPPENPSTILTFTVTDQCGNSNTGQLEIIVKNQFPVVSNLPKAISIAEETTAEVLLATLTITDADDSIFTSENFNIDPDPSSIEIRSEGSNTRSIYSTAGANYDYTSQQIYIMDFSVDDGTDVSNTGYALLYITKNDPPKITNLGQAAYMNTSFVSTVNGETLFTIETSDTESDALTYTISCDPSACPIDKSPKDGVIKTTSDFQGLYEPGYDLTITIEDPTTALADTKAFTILVQEITYRPQITNLPLVDPVLISEGTPLDTIVYTLSYIDLDKSETHTIYAELDPGWAWNYFALNSTSGVISTANNVIDYEFLDSYTANLTIVVTDSFGPTSATVSIEFGDINEAPYFSQTKYTLEPAEKGANGTSAGDPQFEIYDPDAGDTHNYTWDCGDNSRYFVLDKTTGAISYAIYFVLDDLDITDITVPFTCTVTVTDSGGLTGTTELEIDIQDINNYEPDFSQTDYIIYAEPTLTSGKFVGQVSATDDDYSSTNNAIQYSIDDFNDIFNENFIYINDFGNIFVNVPWTNPPFDYGDVIVFRVIALNTVDSNSTHTTRMSATTTVSLVMTATTTVVTTTTDRPVDFIADPRNVAWMSIAVTLAAVFVIMLCLFILVYTMSTKKYRWCCPACRRHLLGLTKVIKQKKIERYKEILRREEEGESSSSSYESSSSSSDNSSSDSEADTQPSAKRIRFKPWERNNNVSSADSKNFKPWTRSERL